MKGARRQADMAFCPPCSVGLERGRRVGTNERRSIGAPVTRSTSSRTTSVYGRSEPPGWQLDVYALGTLSADPADGRIGGMWDRLCERCSSGRPRATPVGSTPRWAGITRFLTSAEVSADEAREMGAAMEALAARVKAGLIGRPRGRASRSPPRAGSGSLEALLRRVHDAGGDHGRPSEDRSRVAHTVGVDSHVGQR